MEENKAKTTESEEMLLRNGVDADVVASEADEGDHTAKDLTAREETQQSENSPQTSPEALPMAQDINRENARRRREEEQRRALKEAHDRAIIETLEGKNPYDGSEMKDGSDVERFLEMKREYLKREEEEADAIAVRERWFDADRAAFSEAYPNVDMGHLIEDERFCRFAEGKVGNLPMKKIYEGYQSFLEEFDEKAKSLAAQALANRLSGPGALGSTRRAEGDSYTAEEVRRMSPREVRENYEKIRNSMTKW